MVYVLIMILFGAVAPQLMRFGQRGRHSPSAIAMLAYGFGGCYTLAVLTSGAFWAPLAEPALLAWGVLSGCTGFGGVLLGMACFKRAGVGVSKATGSLAVVLAALAAWLMWGDPLQLPKWVGLALMPLTFAMLRPRSSGSVHQTWLTTLLLLSACLTAAVTMTAHKSASEQGLEDYEVAYQLVGFATATLLGVAHLTWQGRLPTRLDLGVGSAVGFCFAGSQLATMHALNELPATLIYPIVGTVEVALNVILGRQLWRERLLPRQLAGVGLAILVVLLMSLNGLDA